MKKSEVNAIVKILEGSDEYESVEDAAVAILNQLDEMRAGVTTYAGVIELALSGTPMYQGVGYFPGVKSAMAGIQTHPAAGMAKKIVVVPVVSPKGLTLMLDKLSLPAEPKGDFAQVKEDAALFRLGWDGKMKSRKQYLDLLAARTRV